VRNEPNPALQHENTATCCHGLVLTVLYSDTFGKRNKADQTDEAHERRPLSRSYQKRGVERLYRVSQRAEQFAAQCHLQPDLLSLTNIRGRPYSNLLGLPQYFLLVLSPVAASLSISVFRRISAESIANEVQNTENRFRLSWLFCAQKAPAG